MITLPMLFRSAPGLLLLVLLAAPPSVMAQRAPGHAEGAFAEAFRLFSDHHFEQALSAFEAFQDAYPNHVNAPDALYYQAQAALSLGQEARAIQLLRAFYLQNPSHPLAFEARLALGKYFFGSGDYAQALSTLAEVLDDTPPPPLAAKTLYWMGEAALNLEREDEALGYFQRAADDYRQTDTAPIALYAVAFTRVRQGRYDAAAEAFETLARRHPDSPYARDIGLALAEVYYELGDWGRAVNEIQRRMPNLRGEAQDRATFLLAESYNQMRDSPNAIVYYRHFTEGQPNSPYYRRALFGLAWNYHFEGAYQWAAEQFEKARQGFDDDLAHRATYYEGVNRKLAQAPMQAIDLFRMAAERWPRGPLADQAWFELGATYYEQRMWAQARDTFTHLIDAYPDSERRGEALNLQGNAFIALNNFNEALRSFDRAIGLNAADPTLKQDITFQKAWLLYRNGNYQAAAPAFLDLYQSSPRVDLASEALFWAAESIYQNNNHERATTLFQEYLRTYPNGKRVDATHYALGWTYFRQSRYQDAINAFQRFLASNREDSDFKVYRTDALLRLGDSYYALKRYPEAIRTYGQVVEMGEDYPLYQIAQAFSNQGETFEAITMFRRILKDYPTSEWREEAQYSLGYLYFLNQDFDQAVAEYGKLIATAPSDPLAAKAQYGIGDALFNAGRHDAAVDAYQTVLSRYPNSPFAADAAGGIQFALIALGDAARANAIIEDFARRNPNSPVVDELRFRQAEVKYQSGNKDEALNHFQQFIRTTRNNALLPEAYYYMGLIYSERNQLQEAESYLRQLVQAFPNSQRRAEAAGQLGQLLLDQQRYREALTTFQAMETAATQQRDPRRAAQARYGQSMALMQLGRTPEAERLLRDAIAVAPDAPETAPALLGLARIYEQSGRTGEALNLYREIANRSRDEAGAESLVRLGALLIRQGQPRAALDELGRLPTLFSGYYTWEAQGYLLQARAFAALGDAGEAARYYDMVIAQYFDTPHAETAKQEKAAL